MRNSLGWKLASAVRRPPGGIFRGVSIVARFVAAAVFAVLLFGQPLLADPPAAAPPVEIDKKPDRISDEAFGLLLQAYQYDPAISLDGRVVERDERVSRNEESSGPRDKIVFRGAQGFYVPGYLQLPRKPSGRVPCVLLLHGWSGSKINFWADNNYISGGNIRKGLLKEGIAVLALDAQCHGDRISQNEFQPVNPSGPPGAPPRKGYFTQQEIYIQTTIDYRRAIDYLKERPDIDSSRIGALGYSMGGTQTFLLTAVDLRIKAAVACAAPADRSASSLIAPRNVAHAIGSRPFLIIMGRQDEMCPPEEAQRVARMIGGTASKLTFFEGTHRMSRDFVPDAIHWLKEHL